MDDETRPLIGSSNPTTNAKYLYRNFLTMCIGFSLNHGCVVSCLAYSSTELGDVLGSYGSGCLYVTYAVTAFLFSKPIVSMIGPKYGLLAGVVGYCVYVFGFLFAIVVPSAATPVFLTAASIGGVAGGLLWPSQGRYFARNAALYAEATSTPVEAVNSTFAGIFAASYLGLEMVTKVLATIVFLTAPDIADFLIFSIYSAIAVAACFSVMSLHHLDEHGTWDFNTRVITLNVAATARLLWEDVRLLLMIPFQVAFGFTSSFVPFYVFGTVIADSDNLGGKWVGLLSAIIVFTGAITAIPAAWAANKLGKATVMTIGGLCLLYAGFIYLVVDSSKFGNWSMICIYLIVYGIGRGTWVRSLILMLLFVCILF
jgi:hypothetical protein